MNPVDKALWFIEAHFESAISLDEIATNAEVSKFYLLRAFNAATGLSIMRYVRGRRLTGAARRLASGAQDILSVAIDYGYGSHEAFTRAFREQFGLTPESLREQGHLENIVLLEAIVRKSEKSTSIEAPRLVDGKLLLIAGLNQRYEEGDSGAKIPAQWQRFERHLGSIRGQVGQTTYGVCYNTDDEGSMDYLCGVEVTEFNSLPAEFTRLRLPPQKYVVFFHREHVSAIRSTWNAVWNEWLPNSEYQAADAPLFERYDERFDPHSGNGGVELWVPIKA